ncbi:MAG: acyltransferase domain-containing protein, partial [Pseudomonadales bacterium]
AVTVADAPSACEPWRADFGASADWVSREDLRVPSGGELVALCTTLGFPDTAVRHLADQRPTWDDPRIRRLGAHVQWMIADRYTPTGYHRLGWPSVFSRCPLFYAYAALGLARRVAREQSERGIDAEVTRTTLRDIGQQVYLHDRVYGEVGMNKGWWLCHHLSHHLYRLGRLQFQRGRARRAFGPVPPDAPFLDVHIPEDGPLDPSACDAALARAAPFLARYHPDENARFLACTSWLLDPVLAELLPAGSNIVAFQRRFERHELRDGPSSVFEFVFDRPDLDRTEVPDVSVLPRDTHLRAAIVGHYARGGVIRMGVGTIPL